MFSLTGWKVGWVSGPKDLMRVVANAHQFITFTTSPALQLGIAYALEREMDFTLASDEDASGQSRSPEGRDREAGFPAARVRRLVLPHRRYPRLTNESDRAFCERLVREAGVALIPLSVFFADGTPDNLVRFAFCKKRSVIDGCGGAVGEVFQLIVIPGEHRRGSVDAREGDPGD